MAQIDTKMPGKKSFDAALHLRLDQIVKDEIVRRASDAGTDASTWARMELYKLLGFSRGDTRKSRRR